MAAIVITIDGRGLRIEEHCRNQPEMSKLALYMLLFSLEYSIYMAIHKQQD